MKEGAGEHSQTICQNLLNQRKDFILPFFTTMQLVMVENDTQGLQYDTIETSENITLNRKNTAVLVIISWINISHLYAQEASLA